MRPTASGTSLGLVASLAAAAAIACGKEPSPGVIAPSATITLGADVTSLAPIPGGPFVVAGLADGQVLGWHGPSGKTLALGRRDKTRVLAVASAPDHSEVWSLADDGSVSRYPIEPDTPTVSNVELGQPSTRAAVFAADGSTLVTGNELGELRVFARLSGAPLHVIRGHRTEIQALAMRPGAPIAASASAEADLRLWDVITGKELANAEGDLSLFSLAFSPRAGTLAAGGVDRKLTLRDPTTLKATSEFTLKAPEMVAAIMWSPDGQRIAVGDIDDASLAKGGIRILDAATRAVVATLDTGGVAAVGLVFADATTVVAASGRDLRAWTVPAR